jgi:wobble nucleotide-excising tRNase
MDSGVLFVASSLVRKLVEDCFLDGGQFNIKQIFVLTHNPYFHKEISHKYKTSRDEVGQNS